METSLGATGTVREGRSGVRKCVGNAKLTQWKLVYLVLGFTGTKLIIDVTSGKLCVINNVPAYSPKCERILQCYIMYCLAKHIHTNRSKAVKQLWWKKRATSCQPGKIQLSSIKKKQKTARSSEYSILWIQFPIHYSPSAYRSLLILIGSAYALACFCCCTSKQVNWWEWWEVEN